MRDTWRGSGDLGCGRNWGANGPLVGPVAWKGVSAFVVTDVERAVSCPRKPVKERLAVRVPMAAAGVRHFAPAAYVVCGGEDAVKSYVAEAGRLDRRRAFAPAALGR